MASTIGELLLKISADSAKLRSELDKAAGEVKSFLGEIKESAEAIKELLFIEKIVEAGEKLAEFIGESAKAGQELVNMSQILGASVEEMTRLGFAARQAGLDNEQLITGVERLSRNMMYAIQGNGRAAGAFRALGIEVQEADGKLKNDVETMMEVADEFKDMQDGAGKTALAIMMFGRAGAELIPMLNLGSEGIEQLMERSDKLARTIGTDAAQSAARFNQDLSMLKGGMEVLGIMIVNTLEPAFTAWLNSIEDGTGQLTAFQEIANAVGFAVKLLAGMVLVLESGFERLGIRIAGVQAVIENIPNGWAAVRNELYKTGKALEEEAERYNKIMDNLGFVDKPGLLYQRPVNGLAPGDEDYDAAVAGNYISHHEATKEEAPIVDESGAKALENAIKQIEDRITSLKEKTGTLGLDEGAAMKWSIQFGKMGELLDLVGEHAAALRTKLGELQKKYADAVDAGDDKKMVKLKRQIDEIKSELADADKGALAARLQSAANEYAAAKEAEKIAKDGANAFQKLTDEVDKNALSLIKQKDGSYESAMAFRIQYGDISKLVEMMQKAGYVTSGLTDELMRLAKARDQQKVQEEGQKAQASLEQTTTKLAEKTAELVLFTERQRTEWSLANGELKKYVDAMKAAGMSTDDLRAKLLAQADAYDKTKRIQEVISAAQSAYEDAKTPAQKYRETVDLLNDPISRAALSQDQLNAALKKAREDFERAGGEMNKFSQSVRKNMTDSFASAVEQSSNLVDGLSKGFENMGDAWVKTVKRMAAEALAADLMGSLGFGPNGGAGTDAMNWLGDFMGVGGSKAGKVNNKGAVAGSAGLNLVGGAGDIKALNPATVTAGSLTAPSANLASIEAASLTVGSIHAGGGLGGGAGAGGGGLPDLGGLGVLKGDEEGIEDYEWEAPDFTGGASDDWQGVPFLAGGGSAFTNRPYIIGEKGPELFVPRTTGSVMSNDELLASLSGAAGKSNGAAPILQLHPDAMNMTLRDWFESEMARQAANR